MVMWRKRRYQGAELLTRKARQDTSVSFPLEGLIKKLLHKSYFKFITVIEIYYFFLFFFFPFALLTVCGFFQRDVRKYCLVTYWHLNLLSCRTGFTYFLLTLHSVVEFKMEESMKKAAEVLNKHSLSGRPLKVKEVSSWNTVDTICSCRVSLFRVRKRQNSPWWHFTEQNNQLSLTRRVSHRLQQSFL